MIPLMPAATGPVSYTHLDVYKRQMPNPALLATTEFLEDKVYYRKNDEDLFS